MFSSEGFLLGSELFVQLWDRPGTPRQFFQAAPRLGKGVGSRAPHVGPKIPGRSFALEIGKTRLSGQAHHDTRGFDDQAGAPGSSGTGPEFLQGPGHLAPIALVRQSMARVEILSRSTRNQTGLHLGQLKSQPARPPGHGQVARIVAPDLGLRQADQLLESRRPGLDHRLGFHTAADQGTGRLGQAPAAPFVGNRLPQDLTPEGASVALAGHGEAFGQELRVMGPEGQSRLKVDARLLEIARVPGTPTGGEHGPGGIGRNDLGGLDQRQHKQEGT